jgi:hypothetical protein
MAEIFASLVKLLSWAVLAARSRWGFGLAVVGELVTGYVMVRVGLLWLAGYCFIAAAIQAFGFYNWRDK